MNRFSLIRNAEVIRQDILDLLPGFDVLSVDFFDTLASRCEVNPADVFLRLHDDTNGINERRRAEYRVRQAALLADQHEVLLEEIHAASGEGAQAAASAELDAEQATLDVVPEVLAILQAARRLGLRIAVTSDTYLPESLFAEFCARHDVPHDIIITSAAHRQSKEHGGLFAVLRGWAGPRARILHLGDNIGSDVHSALNAGVLGRFIPSMRQMTGMDALPVLETLSQTEREALRRLLVGAQQRVSAACDADTSPDLPHALAVYIGQFVLGPLWLGFSHWLRQEATRQRVDRLYFLARDGHCLQRAFRTMFPEDSSNSYIYLSRSALYLPAAASGSDVYFNKLFQNYGGLIGMQLLRRLRLDDNDIYAATTEEDRDVLRRRPPFDQETSARLHDVLRKLRGLIEARGALETNALLEYLGAQDMTAQARVGVIDLGWHNSLQICLGEIFGQARCATKIHGFYMGTFAHIPGVRDGDSSQGFLFDRGLPEQRLSAVTPAVTLLELLHAAPHGSTLAISPETARPVLIVSAAEGADHVRFISQCHEQALAFITHAMEVLGVAAERVGPYLADLAAAHIGGLFKEPGLPEARTLGTLRVASDFGVLGPMRQLAAPAPSLTDGSLWPAATRLLGAYRVAADEADRVLFQFDPRAHLGLSVEAEPQQGTSLRGLVVGFSGPLDRIPLTCGQDGLRVSFPHDGPWKWRDLQFELASSPLLESSEVEVVFEISASQPTLFSLTVRDFLTFDYTGGFSDADWQFHTFGPERRPFRTVFHLHPRVVDETLRERRLLIALPLEGSVDVVVHSITVSSI